jgi:hypothetical protein
MNNVLRLISGSLMLLCVPHLVGAQTTAAGSSDGPRGGIAVKASTLGIGIDAAVGVQSKVNLRGSFNFASYTRDFDDTDNNIVYNGELSFRSFAATLDWFPTGGSFHVSPTFVISNKNKVSLSSLIPAGQTIDIDDVEYRSSSANPIKAAGEITVKSARPGVLIGWGNIAGGKRVKVPFELGVIFGGVPTGTLSFTGTACQPNGLNCRDMGTDPTIQSHIRAAEQELNDNKVLKLARFYPVISLGIGFRF